MPKTKTSAPPAVSEIDLENFKEDVIRLEKEAKALDDKVQDAKENLKELKQARAAVIAELRATVRGLYEPMPLYEANGLHAAPETTPMKAQ